MFRSGQHVLYCYVDDGKKLKMLQMPPDPLTLTVQAARFIPEGVGT